MIKNIDFIPFPDLNLEPIIQTVIPQSEQTKKSSGILLFIVLAVIAIIFVVIVVLIKNEKQLEKEVSE